MTGSVLPLLVVAVEALLALGVLFVLHLARARTQRRRSRASARRLVERIRGQEPERLTAVRQLLITAGGMDEKAALRQADELMARERSVYSRVLTAFLGRDVNALDDLEQRVAELADGYRKLGELSGRAPHPSGDDADLQRQNRELQSQLAQANENLENLTREYMAVYRQQAASKEKSAGAAAPKPPEPKSGD
ncbi:MAG: hypothetical protein P8076_04910 [Gammaproteobacteria bacterium]